MAAGWPWTAARRVLICQPTALPPLSTLRAHRTTTTPAEQAALLTARSLTPELAASSKSNPCRPWICSIDNPTYDTDANARHWAIGCCRQPSRGPSALRVEDPLFRGVDKLFPRRGPEEKHDAIRGATNGYSLILVRNLDAATVLAERASAPFDRFWPCRSQRALQG